MRFDLKAFVGAGGTIVSDGAWGTQLQSCGLAGGVAPELWNVENPSAVEAVARSYVEAGSDVILTNTFGANRVALASHGASERVGELARAVADGGADAIVLETFNELAELQIALDAVSDSCDLAVVASMTFASGVDGTSTIMGDTPADLAAAAAAGGASAVGANCGVGPDNYVKVAALLREATLLPVWIKANAGLPTIDKDTLPGHIFACIGGKEDNNPVEVMRLTGTFERDTVCQIFHPLFIIVQNFIQLCSEPAGSETIDCNPVYTPVVRKAHCKLFNSALACTIRGNSGVSEHRSYRTDIDNPSVFHRYHFLCDRLCGEKRAS